MNVRAPDLAAYALLTVSVLAGLVLWPALPDSMAIHFGGSGEPDSFVEKPLAVVLTPGIGLASVLVMRYGPDWMSRTYTSPHIEDVTVVFVAGVIAYAQGFLYAWNLGFRLPPTVFVAVPVFAAALAFAAYSYTRGGSLG